MTKTKLKTIHSKVIPNLSLDNLIQARIDYYNGTEVKDIAKSYKTTTHIINKKFQALDSLSVAISENKQLSVENKILNSTLERKLAPIRETLTDRSIEIIKEADKVTMELLPLAEKATDSAKVSDIYSKRLARLTGLEVDPEAGSSEAKVKKDAPIYIQNIFNRFNDKKEEEEITHDQ